MSQPDFQAQPEPQPSPQNGQPYGQPPQFAQSPEAPSQYGYGQPPSYGQDPAYGQAPSYGQSPEYAPYGQQSHGQTPPPAPYNPGYAPQQYGQPAYGYGAMAEHPQAQTVLILGILGIFVPIVQFVAWYMGGKAKKEIEAGAPYQWEGSLKIGYLLGKIFSIIAIVVSVLYVVLMIIGFAAIAAGY